MENKLAAGGPDLETARFEIGLDWELADMSAL
jgi:hypothetical protein